VRRAGSGAPFLVLAAALLFSTGGAAIKGTAFTAWQVSALRCSVAAVAVLLLLPEARRGWRWRSVPVAMSYAATLLLFVAATKLTTAANAILLQGSAPLFVLILGPLLLKEHIRRSQLALMAVVGCGMAMFFLGRDAITAIAPNPQLGNTIASCSAITWALTIIGLRWLGRDAGDQGMSTVALGNIIAAVIAWPVALPMATLTIRDIVIVLWLGLFQVALAYVCLTRGIRSVPAFEATTLLLLEPALNPVWVWLLHGERPSALPLAGGAIILAATLVNAWWSNRSLPAPSVQAQYRRSA
jgi:drug/metabolite transporter (DMT)-like permease